MGVVGQADGGGQAAGTAAAMAAKTGGSVQDVDVPSLRARLVEGKQVVDFVAGQPTRFPHGTNGPPEF